MGKKLVRKALDMLKTLSEESEKKQKVCYYRMLLCMYKVSVQQ
jgi:hypothetical protein